MKTFSFYLIYITAVASIFFLASCSSGKSPRPEVKNRMSRSSETRQVRRIKLQGEAETRYQLITPSRRIRFQGNDALKK